MDLKYTITVFLICALACFTTSVLSKCPEISSNVTLVPCGHLNATKDQCLNWGCCWNESSDANATGCYGIANNQSVVNATVPMTTVKTPLTKVNTSTVDKHEGFCHVYRAGACDRWLNYTMLEYRWTPRFIDYRFGLNGTENLILEFMKVIGRIKGQERCREILKTLLCEYFLPPCNEANEPYKFCREDCEAVFKTCHTAITELVGAAKYFVEELGDNLGHAEVPDCEKHRYSAEYKAENSTCVHFGLFTFSPTVEVKDEEKETSSKLNIIALAGAVVGIVPVAVVILIIAIVTKRRGKVVSIKNRVQVEKHRASEEDKIASLFKPDDVKQIPLTRIEYIRDLGSWNFGSVFLGRAHTLIKGKDDAGVRVAVKTLAKESSTETKENFIEKLALMSLLHHENILELLAVSTVEEPYGMIFEYMELGDLAQFLRRAGPGFEGEEKERVYLTQEDLVSISFQCAAGMEHLQRLKFVHSDVSSRNCLVGHGLTVKIADLGMARHVYVSDYYKMEGRGSLPIRWMAPEALFLRKFSLESDVYSFGVLLWEIFTLALQPYYGYSDEEVIEFINEGVHLGKTDYCPDHVFEIMKSCWNQEASERPKFTLIMAELKPKMTSDYDSLRYSQSIPDQEPLYQRIGSPIMELKEVATPTHQVTLEISKQAPDTPPPSMHQPGPAYENVVRKLSFHSDEEEGFFELDIEQEAY